MGSGQDERTDPAPSARAPGSQRVGKRRRRKPARKNEAKRPRRRGNPGGWAVAEGKGALEKDRAAGSVSRCRILHCRLDVGTYMSGTSGRARMIIWRRERRAGWGWEAGSSRTPHRRRRHGDGEAGTGRAWWTSRCTAAPWKGRGQQLAERAEGGQGMPGRTFCSPVSFTCTALNTPLPPGRPRSGTPCESRS